LRAKLYLEQAREGLPADQLKWLTSRGLDAGRTSAVIARSVSSEAIQRKAWIASRSLSPGGALAPTRWLAMTQTLNAPE
jgi:hypothetical protein